jgi:hypothetical protein
MNVSHYEHQYDDVYYVWLADGRQGTMRGDGEEGWCWHEHTFQAEPPYIPPND